MLKFNFCIKQLFFNIILLLYKIIFKASKHKIRTKCIRLGVKI